jgi:hypothetical protein
MLCKHTDMSIVPRDRARTAHPPSVAVLLTSCTKGALRKQASVVVSPFLHMPHDGFVSTRVLQLT